MKKLLLFLSGILMMVVGVFLLAHEAEVWFENEQKAMKWYSDAASAPLRIPPSFHWAPAMQKEPFQQERVEWNPQPRLHSKLGTLRIPSIDARIPVFFGTSDQELDQGLGLHQSCSLPGEGTAVIAGHREHALKGAGRVKIGDELIFQTDKGELVYQVTRIRIVPWDDRTVVVPSDKQELKVYTCFPIVPGASTDKRLVLQAELIQ
ncbi:hypothetical protein GCM10011571_33400 [Marinithermofilum abyssi]|uniref:Sortase A n=1 Tax=Marinithermofilum abyssi TaxID=1571185 RepID=A0A8J2VLT5_9BACL|nr:class D sortase [Marinithermofilum abyssi]GGE28629.1 hypothetical protein GCM10011571_33400 [Marinithermofilum abyssi]